MAIFGRVLGFLDLPPTLWDRLIARTPTFSQPQLLFDKTEYLGSGQVRCHALTSQPLDRLDLFRC